MSQGGLSRLGEVSKLCGSGHLASFGPPLGIWIRNRAIQSETFPENNYGNVILTVPGKPAPDPIKIAAVKPFGVGVNTKSAIEVAVENRNAAMVRLLLDRGATLSDAPSVG